MAQVTRAAFASSVASLLADNSAGDISAADMRSLLTDLEDSARWHDEAESGSTADQTDAEIETAYNNQVSQVSAGERTAGTETAIRRFAPADIASMAGTHGGGGASLTETYENATGSTIAALKVVYVSGFGTSHPQIALADADSASALPAIGITTASIANGASGSVQFAGVLTGVDTSSFTQGDLLYVSGTAGDMTATEPTSGHSQPIALVERSHASLGELRVNPGRPLAVADTSVNAQTGTTYTLVIGDAGRHMTMSNASANTLTIPTNASVAFDTGAVIAVTMLGAGVTTVVGATGVTVNGVSGGGAAIDAQYKGVTLTKIGTDTWLMQGAHGAVS